MLIEHRWQGDALDAGKLHHIELICAGPVISHRATFLNVV